MLIGVTVAGACGSTACVPPPPSPRRVYGASEVDERPEIVQTPPLHYPEGGRQGVVVVRAVIDTAGNPEPATALVVQGSDSVLAAAARTLVRNTLFRAARVRGQVVRTLRSEEHTSELQSQSNLVCRLLLEKKKKKKTE